MIQSRQDLKNYIKADLRAQGIGRISGKERLLSLLCPAIWKFEVKLRRLEYACNCRRKGPLGRLLYSLRYRRYERYAAKLGFTIPPNVFGPGLCLCHRGTIIVNGACKIGKNARIHADVNIGDAGQVTADETGQDAPVIGDNVYIGPGAKIFGAITIGNDVAIGANAVVNRDLPDHVTAAGVPAKMIGDQGSAGRILT